MLLLDHKNPFLLNAAQLETPLGIMLAIANDKALCFLDFVNEEAIASLNRKLARMTLRGILGKWEREDERWETSFFKNENCHLPRLERKIKRLCLVTKSSIAPGRNKIIDGIEQELVFYFEGKIKTFQTPYVLFGSSFQQEAWKMLLTIPYGSTVSYAQEAAAIGNPLAVRAVANANGANQLAIVIPCHRVISSDGSLGGYGSGLSRKEGLLELEKKHR